MIIVIKVHGGVYACLDICGVCPSIYLYKITLEFR